MAIQSWVGNWVYSKRARTSNSGNSHNALGDSVWTEVNELSGCKPWKWGMSKGLLLSLGLERASRRPEVAFDLLFSAWTSMWIVRSCFSLKLSFQISDQAPPGNWMLISALFHGCEVTLLERWITINERACPISPTPEHVVVQNYSVHQVYCSYPSD